jgi:diketogulonate reductase-like aldo/keto reductase
LYGNEADVGEAIRTSQVPRDEIFVTTKVWNDDQGFDTTLKAFERSQRRLGIGAVDLYLMHWPVSSQRLETWRALRQLRREGRCQSIGVCNFTLRHLEELEAQSGELPVVNQVEFNPYLFQRDLLQYCTAHGIQLEAWAPLVRAQRMDDPTLRAVARAHHASPAQILIRWGLQHEVVEIPKSVQADRIRENAQVFGFQLLPDEMDALDRLDAQFRTGWDPTGMA